MTKPFSLKELYARTEAISRRTAGDLKPLARPKKIFTRNDLILTAMTGSLTPISKTSEKKWRIKDFSDNLAAGLSDQYDAETGKWNLDYILTVYDKDQQIKLMRISGIVSDMKRMKQIENENLAFCRSPWICCS